MSDATLIQYKKHGHTHARMMNALKILTLQLIQDEQTKNKTQQRQKQRQGLAAAA